MFSRRWPHKWEKTFTDPKARDLWLIDLRGLGVTPDQVKRGLHKSAALSWPPSPAEFAALCVPSPAELGLPPVAEAFRAACHGRWIHPAVYEAARRVGNFELRNQAEARSRPEFEHEYAEVCAEFMAGKTEHWPKPRTEAAKLLENQRKLWVGKPELAKQRCDVLRRCIGPFAEQRKPEPVQPANDEDFAERMALDRSALELRRQYEEHLQ